MGIERFSPKMLEAWRAAATTSLIVRFPTMAQSTTFRARMYSLRKAIQKEDPTLYRQIAGLKLVRTTEGNRWAIVFQPADIGFDEALDSAGIAQPEAPGEDLLEFDIEDETPTGLQEGQ